MSKDEQKSADMSEGTSSRPDLSDSDHSSTSHGDGPILPLPPKKRRAIKSGSTFLPPSRIAKIFPEIEVEQLCLLSEPPLTPNEVLEIVPNVSVDQISKYFDLSDEFKHS